MSSFIAGTIGLTDVEARSLSPAHAKVLVSLAGRVRALHEMATGRSIADGEQPSINRNPQGLYGVDFSGPPNGSAFRHCLGGSGGLKPDNAGAGAWEGHRTVGSCVAGAPLVVPVKIFVRPHASSVEDTPYSRGYLHARVYQASAVGSFTVTVKLRAMPGSEIGQRVGTFAATSVSEAAVVPAASGTEVYFDLQPGINDLELEFSTTSTTAAHIASYSINQTAKRSHAGEPLGVSAPFTGALTQWIDISNSSSVTRSPTAYVGLQSVRSPNAFPLGNPAFVTSFAGEDGGNAYRGGPGDPPLLLAEQNGLDVVRLTRVDLADLLCVNFDVSNYFTASGFHTFVVWKPTANPRARNADQYLNGGLWCPGGGNVGMGFDLVGETPTLFAHNDSGTGATVGRVYANTASAAINTWQIAEAFHGGGLLGVAVNGGPFVTSVSQDTRTAAFSGTSHFIGNHPSSNFYVDMDFAALLVSSRELTAPERAQTILALKTQWGIP